MSILYIGHLWQLQLATRPGFPLLMKTQFPAMETLHLARFLGPLVGALSTLGHGLDFPGQVRWRTRDALGLCRDDYRGSGVSVLFLPLGGSEGNFVGFFCLFHGAFHAYWNW